MKFFLAAFGVVSMVCVGVVGTAAGLVVYDNYHDATALFCIGGFLPVLLFFVGVFSDPGL